MLVAKIVSSIPFILQIELSSFSHEIKKIDKTNKNVIFKNHNCMPSP